jgi:hypothetical protein
MKQIRLRVTITAEDAATIDAVQTRLTELLDATGTEHLPRPNGDANGEDLAGPIKGPRVFWMTADVKQGNDRAPETATRKRGTKP